MTNPTLPKSKINPTQTTKIERRTNAVIQSRFEQYWKALSKLIYKQKYRILEVNHLGVNAQFYAYRLDELSLEELDAELKRLLEQKRSALSQHRLISIEQQMASIITAIDANNSMNKADTITLNANKQRSYKKAAQKLFQPIQNLYSQLSETIEFERRLLVMLAEKQAILSSSPPNKKVQATDDVLIVHQRLGRCRQAISKIERQIETQEKR